jgi:signal transduction histidine kinase
MSPAIDRSEARVGRLVLTAVVLPFVLAAIAAAWFAWQIARISAVADWIDSSDRVIALVAEAQRLVVDRELALRAFLFTEDPRTLAQYRRTSPDEDLDELERLLAGRPAQTAELHAFGDLYERSREQAEEAIESPSRGARVTLLRERKAFIDAIRARGAAIASSEKATRLEHSRRLERETRGTTLGAVSVLALLAAAASLSSRHQIRLIVSLVRREREALAQAQASLRAKDAFLTNLSHELRTPLTPLLGWVSLLRTKRLQGEVLERALALIERSARAEAQIVDEVLDISRMSAGQLRMAPVRVDPTAAVRAAVDVVELAARAKGITLEAAVAEPLPMILADPARLQQIAWILLGNAVKFTPRGGRVGLRLDRCAGGVRLRVTDDGEGIPADFLPHVFESFRQADASMKRAHGGLGLGLALVRHLVEAHGGEVDVASDGEGRGATFTVTLPEAAGPPAAPVAAPASARSPRASRLRGVRVLVVADDPSACELLATSLRTYGASVHAAVSAPAARELLEQASIDVVVAELALPGNGAADLAGALRDAPPGRRPPVLALTSCAGDEEARQALEAGFQGYVPRPVTPEALVGAVAALVEGPPSG